MSKSEIYSLQDYTTLDLVEEDTDSATAVAGITDVTISAAVSMETLYTADSTKVADKMQHEHVVNVDISHMFANGDLQGQWLGGSGGTTATSWEDSSDPQLFELTGVFEARDGSQEINITVTGISWDEAPMFIGSQGEYSEWSWDGGEGEDITNYEVTTPA